MKLIGKNDFRAFVNRLIEDGTWDIEGVKSKGDKFVFGPLESGSELRLDYDVTILPPKKYFLPQYETMMKFDMSKPFDIEPLADYTKRIIIGVHPYDISAIQQMDKYYLDTDVDHTYLKKRKNTLIIGLLPVNISDKAFFGTMAKMNGEPPEIGFDLMLVVVDDEIAIIPGSIAGQDLLSKAPGLRDATLEEMGRVKALQAETSDKASRSLQVGPKGWQDLLAHNHGSEVWKSQSDKCLSCGSCTLVCPTCFCFDVTDDVNLDVTTGGRTRTWDGCLLRDFTKVGTGEIFREGILERYRHRFHRKGAYLPDRFGFVACVGCGRCASQCPPDIADPVDLFNMLADETIEPVAENETAPVGKIDLEEAPDKGPLYLPKPATLRRVEKLTELETLFEIALDSGEPLGHQPGQFVEVSVPGFGEAPISVSSAPGGNTFQIVVRKVGDVTTKLHSLAADDKIGIRGPFGTGFDTEALKGKDLLFICAGLGVVPIRSLINYVLAHRADYGKVSILYGCKEPLEQLFLDEVDGWRARPDVDYIECVDACPDGQCWEGNIGVITTIIPKADFDPRETMAIVVGPPIVYRFVNRDLLNLGMPKENIIVSLERRMKCGVGKCGHCQINGVYVCKEGPVFNFKDLENLPEAFE